MSRPSENNRSGRWPGLSFKLAVAVLTATGLIFAAAFGYNYEQSRELLLHNVSARARALTLATVHKLEETLKGLEVVPDMTAHGMGQGHAGLDATLNALRDFLETTPEAYGGGVFLEPRALSDAPRTALYFAKKGGALGLSELGEDYDYFHMDWYMLPKLLGRGVWSEPYYDEAGGEILMATYAAPVYREQGRRRVFLGVITADVSLEWLRRVVGSLSIYESGYAFLISKGGLFVSHPEGRYLMRESIFSLAEAREDENLREIGRAMTRGRQGFARLDANYFGEPVYVSYAPMPSTEWSLGLVIEEDELMSDLVTLHREVLFIGASGFLALLVLIIAISTAITRPITQLARKTAEIARGNLDVDLPVVRRRDEVGELSRSFHEMRSALKEYIANLTEATRAKERLESELKIARTIQMSFLPKRFPPFPRIKAFSLHAALVPAYEVGGDLYDFFLLDDRRLFFSVGDVSGKGVPAALFMAVTKTLMKGIAEQDFDPAEVLRKVNNELAADNDALLFVTLFCGVLDFETGELAYSNAGHNPPAILRRDGRVDPLSLPPGMAMGVMPDLEYETMRVHLAPGETLMAYTDGVNEAQDVDGALYGDARLLALLRDAPRLDPEHLTETIFADVRRFAGEADQADDITVLALRWNGPTD